MATVLEAHAIWDGNITDGFGTIDLEPCGEGRFDLVEMRFKEGERHNPESLAAGAAAGSYAMALAGDLAEEGFTPAEIRVSARVVLEQGPELPFIPTVNLSVRARVNNLKHEKLLAITERARKNCPVANLFAGAEITLEADMFGG